MLKKYGLILFILILVFMGGAYASDVNQTSAALDSASNDDISIDAQEGNELISMPNQEDVLADDEGTFSQLKEMIDGNESKSTVYLDKNYASSGYSSQGIVIDKEITIDGKGHTLDGQKTSRIFNIQAPNVVLKNITFINAQNCTVFFTGGDLTIEDCEFINNAASVNDILMITDVTGNDKEFIKYSGESILYANATGNISISKSKFKDSSIGDYGIHIENATTVSFNDNVFENNKGVNFNEEDEKYWYTPAGDLININSNNVNLTDNTFMNNYILTLIRITSANDTAIKGLKVENITANTNLHLSAGGSTSLVDVSISNVKSQSAETIHVDTEGDVNVENLSIEKVSPDSISKYYDDDGKILWDNTTVHSVFCLDFSSNNGNAIFKNLTFDNVQTGEENDFLEVSAINVTVVDVFVTNSALSEGEEGSIEISAEENLIMDNWLFNNNSRGIGVNHTYYDDESRRYVYDYVEEDSKSLSFFCTAGKNATITNLQVNNTEIGTDIGFLLVESGNLTLDNITVENTPLTLRTNIYYDSDLAMEVYDTVSSEYSLSFTLSAIDEAFISNIKADNISSAAYEPIFFAHAKNLTVQNISLTNSALSGSECDNPIVFEAENLLIDNFTAENITQSPGMKHTYYDYGKYIYEEYCDIEGDAFAIQVSSENNTVLRNIFLKNIVGGGVSFILDVHSENITADNIWIENVTPPAQYSIQYSSYEGGYIYNENPSQFTSGIEFYGSQTVNVSNVHVDNTFSHVTGEPFFYVQGGNVSVVNVSLSNSKVSGDESDSMHIGASCNLYVDNFSAENLSNGPVYNYTYYTNGEYLWDYYSEGAGVVGLALRAGENATVTNVRLKDIADAGEEFFSLESSNAVVENITLENITAFTGPISYEYDANLGEYIYSRSAQGGMCGIELYIAKDLSISNFNVSNYTTNKDFLRVYAGNVSIDDFSVKDSSISGENSVLINAKSLTINNFTMDNISKGPGLNYTSYYSDYQKYIAQDYGSAEPLTMSISADENITIQNMQLRNIEDVGSKLMQITSYNVTADNITVENIAANLASVSYSYDSTARDYIYTYYATEGACGIGISADNDLNLSNIIISNFTTNRDFLQLFGCNMSIGNFTIKDSAIGGTADIVASGYLTIDNFTADNISHGPGKNSTWYQYNKYIWQYDSSETDFSINANAGEGIKIQNMNLTNIAGGGNRGILAIYCDNNITADNLLIENITEVDKLSFSYHEELEQQVCDSNVSSEFELGLYVSSGNCSFTNVIIRNLLGSGACLINGESVFLENFTVVDIINPGYHYTSFNSNYYESSVYYYCEEGFLITAESNLTIINLLADNIPVGEECGLYGGYNVNITNSTFKNINSLSKIMEYDRFTGEYIIIEEQLPDESGFRIGGINIIMTDTLFENFLIRGDMHGVAITFESENSSLIDNCTFKDIKAAGYQKRYNPSSGTYVIDNQTARGSAVYLIGGVYKNLMNSTFINCSADQGGALYVKESLNITGCEFINCSASEGGAIYVAGNELFINDTLFINNHATNGGAVFFDKYSFNNTFHNVRFIENLADNNGGAVYIYENEDGLNIINASTFYRNHANYNGGAFFFNDTFNRMIWEDYRWHNATASSRIHDDLELISLNNTRLISCEYENNTDYSLNITSHNTAFGGNHTVIIYIDEIAEGLVYVNITDAQGNPIKDKQGNNINGGYLIENGKVVFELEGLEIGDYNVSAYYSGWDYDDDPLYYHVNSTVFSIYPHYINVTANRTVYADENVTVTAMMNNLTTGTVNLTVTDGTNLYRYDEIPVINGTVIYNVTGFYAGNYNVTVTYNGDDIFYPISNTTGFTVIKRQSLIDVSVKDNVYGNTTRIIVEVPQRQTGNVTVTINNQTYVKEVTNGTVEFEIENLTAGEWKANVTFIENRVYNQNNTIFPFNVTKADLTAEVTVNNVTVKENTTFNVSVPDDFKGNVTIKVEGKTYYDGPVSDLITIDKLPAGNYTANVTFYGDDNYNYKNMTADFTVSRVSAEINATITDTTYPNKAVATVNMTNNANGTVIITVDGKNFTTTITNGQATLDLTNLSAGNKVANVTFITKDKYNDNANTTATFTVFKTNSTLIILADGRDIVVVVPQNATGNVTIYAEGKEYSREIVNGNATLKDVLLIGNNAVVAFYDGDANYDRSKNTTNLVFDKYDSYVNASATDSVYGGVTYVTVEVPSNQQPGRVIITVNNITYEADVKQGSAVFNITGLNVGEYQVNVTYIENDEYKLSYNVTSFNVTKADLNAGVIAQNVTYIKNTAFIITVHEDFKGKVNITMDIASYSGNVSSLITLGKLPIGKYAANITFYGDDNYNDETHTVSFIVSETPLWEITTIKAEDLTRAYNSPFDYQAVFLDINGEALINTTVIFKVNGKEYNVTTDEEGVAQLYAKLAVGKYNITSINPVTGELITKNLEIVKRISQNKDVTMDFTDGSKFTLKAWGDDGNIAPEGEIVDIYINKIHYVAKVDKKGYASVKINLLPKKYTVTSEYKGYKTTNKLVIKQILKAVKKTTKIKKSAKSFKLKATLKWSNGKAIKGKKITFKIKGKTYKAKTNKKGVATVKIKKNLIKKLKKGKKYTVKITYAPKLKYGATTVKVSDTVKCYVKVKK